MPFQYLQQICQLYNYENKFVSAGPSFCFDHKLEGMVQRTPAAIFFLRNDHLLNQPLQVLKNLSFHQIETKIYYLSSLSQLVRR